MNMYFGINLGKSVTHYTIPSQEDIGRKRQLKISDIQAMHRFLL